MLTTSIMFDGSPSKPIYHPFHPKQKYINNSCNYHFVVNKIKQFPGIFIHIFLYNFNTHNKTKNIYSFCTSSFIIYFLVFGNFIFASQLSVFTFQNPDINNSMKLVIVEVDFLYVVQP